jgi:deoxyribonuclease-4
LAIINDYQHPYPNPEVSMLNIGCHLSVSKGYAHMVKEALSIGANTFQFFTRNPRGGKAKDMNDDDVAEFNALAKNHGFAPVVAHAPYTLNPCSDADKTRAFAMEAMTDDLARMERLPGNYYNFHPGSHVGQGAEAAIAMISAQLNAILKPSMTTVVLLETMAGKGSEVGGTFEEIRAIIDRVELSDKIGVCMDTCHIYDAGYDIVNDLDGVLEKFDRIVGLSRLKAIHLNDSKNPFSSHKDRHECIGDGSLGLATFEKVVNHDKLKHLPFLLETPNELEGYAKEITLLKGMVK